MLYWIFGQNALVDLEELFGVGLSEVHLEITCLKYVHLN